jgi:asparagine synthetase B (glutamine-hydrolysing)
MLEYLSSWGVPDPSSNGFWLSALRARIAADGVDVILDGEGGDELFATHYHLLADELRRGHVRSVSRLLRSIPGIEPLLPAPRLRAQLLLRFGILGLLPRRPARRWLALAGDLDEPPSYLSDLARGLIDAHDRGDAWREQTGWRWRNRFLDSIAHGGETMGVAEHLQRLQRPWGLLGRHPLQDLDLVRFVLRLPPELGFDPVHTRIAQRAALAGRAPDELRLRADKSFFNGLITASMCGADLRPVTTLLHAPNCLVRRYVRPDAIEEMLRGPPAASLPVADRWATRLLHVVTAECWLREQAEPGFARRVLAREPLEHSSLRWREASSS